MGSATANEHDRKPKRQCGESLLMQSNDGGEAGMGRRYLECANGHGVPEYRGMSMDAGPWNAAKGAGIL